MATGLYPGIGKKLYLASSNAQEPAWQSGVYPSAGDPTIPSGSNSMGVPLNAGITTSFNVLYGTTAPSGTAFNLMYSTQPDFSNEYVYKAVTSVASQKTYYWSISEELDGFMRIANAGSQNITAASVQQRATNVG